MTIHERIRFVWNQDKPAIEQFAKTKLAAGNGDGLYYLQEWTNSLLMYAGSMQDVTLLDELCRTYGIPLKDEYLKEPERYCYQYLEIGRAHV